MFVPDLQTSLTKLLSTELFQRFKHNSELLYLTLHAACGTVAVFYKVKVRDI